MVDVSNIYRAICVCVDSALPIGCVYSIISNSEFNLKSNSKPNSTSNITSYSKSNSKSNTKSENKSNIESNSTSNNKGPGPGRLGFGLWATRVVGGWRAPRARPDPVCFQPVSPGLGGNRCGGWRVEY